MSLCARVHQWVTDGSLCVQGCISGAQMGVFVCKDASMGHRWEFALCVQGCINGAQMGVCIACSRMYQWGTDGSLLCVFKDVSMGHRWEFAFCVQGCINGAQMGAQMAQSMMTCFKITKETEWREPSLIYIGFIACQRNQASSA